MELTSPETVFVTVILVSTLDIIIIIIGCTALGGPWPLQANVASDLYPGHPPANFYNPLSLCLLLSHQSIFGRPCPH
jgi:hypothetical protein